MRHQARRQHGDAATGLATERRCHDGHSERQLPAHRCRVLPKAGTILYTRLLNYDRFDASFDFNIGGGTHSDGMAFILEQDGPDQVGLGGSGLAITGLHGYGVELDTYQSGQCSQDPDSNHVGVDSLANCGDDMPTSLTAGSVTGFILHDGVWHTAQIHFAEGVITVALDGTAYVTAFSIPGWMPGRTYFAGFGAACGVEYDRHSLRNVTITFPTPRCL
jgi:hypothetical protein